MKTALKPTLQPDLLKISLRKNAIFLPKQAIVSTSHNLSKSCLSLAINVRKLGFGFSEDLLQALNRTSAADQNMLLEVLKNILGVNKNWTPLVKDWKIPTNESMYDYVITAIANAFGGMKGTSMPCGHLIPENTFPIERYNGCPYCGTPFEAGEIEFTGQGSKLKVLNLWTDKEMEAYFQDLIQSKTALDATQVDSLKTLLNYYSVSEDTACGMKETLMLLIDALVEKERYEEAGTLFKNPNDVLRYLWYKHTDFLQIIRPKTIVQRISKNNRHIFAPADTSAVAKIKSKADLKLKYNRQECKMVAQWLNNLALKAKACCEIMHPKRGMWVRFIRALRLAEYSKRQGFEQLAEIMDVFYNKSYPITEGRINYYRLRMDSQKTFAILKQRPGLFARSLFSNMLWFGAEETLYHFQEIVDKVPARLLLTLNMYTDVYFDPAASRSVKPLGGTTKTIPTNQYLKIYDTAQLEHMKASVKELCVNVMTERFANQYNENQTIFIDKGLFKIPLAIGDRSEGVQDLPTALMGTRFPLEGSKIRLFMQWGTGLPAQHLDMDLSAMVSYETTNQYCSYSQLTIPGCQHSGDIIQIPEKIGTAEYIEIDVDVLAKKKAKYVSFTCNAYSNGSLSPNLVVGWMDSKHTMKVSDKTGVAYDPSCVQYMVRVTNTLSKGMVFGLLDVENREVVWLEMPFGGQLVQGLDTKGVKTLLAKLDAKLSIGDLLKIKAKAQGLTAVHEAATADEVYDLAWASNTAAVTQLLVD